MSNDYEAAPSPPSTLQVKPRLSRRRWLILAGICIYGFLNGFVNEITAILRTLTDLLGLQLDHYVYIGQLFNLIKPVAALPSAWLVDKFGLRNTMYVALALTIVRNSSRALLFSPTGSVAWQRLKFLYWSLSSASESLVIVLYFTCLPLKISESWFPQQERSFAWSSIYIVPFMGASVAAFLLPRLVVGQQSIQLLADINLICLLVSVVVVLLTCSKSRPSEPPSERSQLAERQLRERRSFLQDLRNVASDLQILLQLLTCCTFEAMNASIKSLSQDLLASLGLTSVFCGNLLAANSLVMIVMQLIGSWRMDKQRRHRHQSLSSSLVVKRLLGWQWLAFMLQLASLSIGGLLRHDQWWLLMLATMVYSSIACWSAPYYNDMLANLCVGRRVSQATISAVRLSCYILLNNPYQSIFVYLRQVSPSSGQVSYSLSLLFAGIMTTSVGLLYVLCFSGVAPSLLDAPTREAAKDPAGQVESNCE